MGLQWKGVVFWLGWSFSVSDLNISVTIQWAESNGQNLSQNGTRWIQTHGPIHTSWHEDNKHCDYLFCSWKFKTTLVHGKSFNSICAIFYFPSNFLTKSWESTDELLSQYFQTPCYICFLRDKQVTRVNRFESDNNQAHDVSCEIRIWNSSPTTETLRDDSLLYMLIYHHM